MGHYASEMGFGGPSESELRRNERLAKIQKALAKIQLGKFPASLANDLSLVTGQALDYEHHRDHAIARVEAFLATRKRRRR